MRLIDKQDEQVKLRSGDIIIFDRRQEKIHFSRPGTEIFFLKGFKHKGLRRYCLNNRARFKATAELIAVTHGFGIVPLHRDGFWQYQFIKPR